MLDLHDAGGVEFRDYLGLGYEALSERWRAQGREVPSRDDFLAKFGDLDEDGRARALDYIGRAVWESRYKDKGVSFEDFSAKARELAGASGDDERGFFGRVGADVLGTVRGTGRAFVERPGESFPEAGVGVVHGFVNMGLSAMRGMGAAASGINRQVERALAENPDSKLRQWGFDGSSVGANKKRDEEFIKSLDELKRKPRPEQAGYAYNAGQAIGSMGAFILSSPFRGASAAMGASANVGQVHEESGGEASAVALGAAAIVGASEALPLPLFKEFIRGAIKGKAGQKAAHLAVGMLAEGGQEGTAQYLNNAIARLDYDKDRLLSEGVGEGVALGAGAGGVVAGGAGAVGYGARKVGERVRRGRGADVAAGDGRVEPELGDAVPVPDDGAPGMGGTLFDRAVASGAASAEADALVMEVADESHSRRRLDPAGLEQGQEVTISDGGKSNYVGVFEDGGVLIGERDWVSLQEARFAVFNYLDGDGVEREIRNVDWLRGRREFEEADAVYRGEYERMRGRAESGEYGARDVKEFEKHIGKAEYLRVTTLDERNADADMLAELERQARAAKEAEKGVSGAKTPTAKPTQAEAEKSPTSAKKEAEMAADDGKTATPTPETAIDPMTLMPKAETTAPTESHDLIFKKKGGAYSVYMNAEQQAADTPEMRFEPHEAGGWKLRANFYKIPKGADSGSLADVKQAARHFINKKHGANFYPDAPTARTHKPQPLAPDKDGVSVRIPNANRILIWRNAEQQAASPEQADGYIIKRTGHRAQEYTIQIGNQQHKTRNFNNAKTKAADMLAEAFPDGATKTETKQPPANEDSAVRAAKQRRDQQREQKKQADKNESDQFIADQKSNTALNNAIDIPVKKKYQTAKFANGQKEEVQYAVIPIEQVIDSHIADNKNLQYRADEDKGTKDRILRFLEKFDPVTHLGESTTVNDGAPVIVSSGRAITNGRVALIRAALKQPKKRAQYLEFLAEDYDYNANEHPNIKNPILVRVVKRNIPLAEATELAVASNEEFKQATAEISDALADAERIQANPQAFESLAGADDLHAAALEFIKKMVGESEQARYTHYDKTTKVTTVNALGVRRYEQAMTAFVFIHTSNTDKNIGRAMVGQLVGAKDNSLAKKMASLASGLFNGQLAIHVGDVHSDYNVVPALIDLYRMMKAFEGKMNANAFMNDVLSKKGGQADLVSTTNGTAPLLRMVAEAFFFNLSLTPEQASKALLATDSDVVEVDNWKVFNAAQILPRARDFSRLLIEKKDVRGAETAQSGMDFDAADATVGQILGQVIRSGKGSDSEARAARFKASGAAEKAMDRRFSRPRKQDRPLMQFSRTNREQIAANRPALVAEIHRLAAEMLPANVRVEVRDRITDDKGEPVGGFYRHAERLIALSAALDPLGDFHHEVVHALRAAGLISDAEWSVLEAHAKRHWLKRYRIRERYADKTFEEQIEEAIADAFKEYMANRGGRPRNAIERVFERIRAFFERLSYYMHFLGITLPGFPSRVFEDIATGRVAGRRQSQAFHSNVPARARASAFSPPLSIPRSLLKMGLWERRDGNVSVAQVESDAINRLEKQAAALAKMAEKAADDQAKRKFTRQSAEYQVTAKAIRNALKNVSDPKRGAKQKVPVNDFLREVHKSMPKTLMRKSRRDGMARSDDLRNVESTDVVFPLVIPGPGKEVFGAGRIQHHSGRNYIRMERGDGGSGERDIAEWVNWQGSMGASVNLTWDAPANERGGPDAPAVLVMEKAVRDAVESTALEGLRWLKTQHPEVRWVGLPQRNEVSRVQGWRTQDDKNEITEDEINQYIETQYPFLELDEGDIVEEDHLNTFGDIEIDEGSLLTWMGRDGLFSVSRGYYGGENVMKEKALEYSDQSFVYEFNWFISKPHTRDEISNAPGFLVELGKYLDSVKQAVEEASAKRERWYDEHVPKVEALLDGNDEAATEKAIKEAASAFPDADADMEHILAVASDALDKATANEQNEIAKSRLGIDFVGSIPFVRQAETLYEMSREIAEREYREHHEYFGGGALRVPDFSELDQDSKGVVRMYTKPRKGERSGGLVGLYPNTLERVIGKPGLNTTEARKAGMVNDRSDEDWLWFDLRGYEPLPYQPVMYSRPQPSIFDHPGVAAKFDPTRVFEDWGDPKERRKVWRAFEEKAPHELIDILRSGDSRAMDNALAWIAENSQNEWYRKLAAHMRGQFRSVPIAEKKVGGGQVAPRSGHFYDGGYKIQIGYGDLRVSTVLHEAAHAATLNETGGFLQEKPNTDPRVIELRKLKSQVTRFLNAEAKKAGVKVVAKDASNWDYPRKLGSHWFNYGMKDTDEFLTMSLTDPEMQYVLQRMEWRDGKIVGWIDAQADLKGKKTAWDKVVELVRRVLGFGSQYNTVLDEVLRVGMDLVEARREDSAFYFPSTRRGMFEKHWREKVRQAEYRLEEAKSETAKGPPPNLKTEKELADWLAERRAAENRLQFGVDALKNRLDQTKRGFYVNSPPPPDTRYSRAWRRPGTADLLKDDNGEVVTAFQGGSEAYERFDDRLRSENTGAKSARKAIWLSDSKDLAYTYGDIANRFHLRMQNPLRIDASEVPDDILKELPDPPPHIGFEEGNTLNIHDLNTLLGIAEERGHDGLIIENFYDPNIAEPEFDPSNYPGDEEFAYEIFEEELEKFREKYTNTHYAVFNSNQLVHANEVNQGTLFSRPDTDPKDALPDESRKRMAAANKHIAEERRKNPRRKIQEELKDALNRLSRVNEHLPHKPEFGPLVQRMAILLNVPIEIRSEIEAYLYNITNDITPDEVDDLNYYWVLADIATFAQIKPDAPLPFGFENTDQVIKAKEAFDAHFAKPENRHLQKKLAIRQREGDRIRRMLVQSGVLLPEQARNTAYYRRMIIEHMLMSRALEGATRGKDGKLQAGKVFRRLGSTKDFYINLVDVETSWMFRAMMDVKTAEFIKFVKDNFDVLPNLRERAKTENKKAIAALLKRKPKVAEAWGVLTKNIAISFSNFQKLIKPTMNALSAAEREQIPPTVRNVLDELALLKTKERSDRTLEAVTWLAGKSGHTPKLAQLAKQANSILANIGKREQFARQTLADKYIDPRNIQALIDKYHPGGKMRAWQADAWEPGGRQLTYYTGQSISESLQAFIKDIIDEHAAREINIDNDMAGQILTQIQNGIRDQTMVGRARPQMVVPTEVAMMMDNFHAKPMHGFHRTLAELTSLTKIYTLLNPFQWTPYVTTNRWGDLDGALATGQTRPIAKKIRLAAVLLKAMSNDPHDIKGELLRMYKKARGDNKDKEFHRELLRQADMLAKAGEAAMRTMVVMGGPTAIDIHGMTTTHFNRITAQLERAAVRGKYSEFGLKALRWYFGRAKAGAAWLENVPRMAAFLYAYEEMVMKGKSAEDIGLGAVREWMIREENDPEMRAAAWARAVFGDFVMLGQAGRFLRQTYFPFWVWLETNPVRFAQTVRNAHNTAKRLADGRKTSSKYIASMFVALSRLFYLTAMVAAWNWTTDDDDDEEAYRARKGWAPEHLNIWRFPDGKRLVHQFQTAWWSDILGMFGIPEAMHLAREAPEYADWSDVALTIPKSLFDRAFSSLNVWLKLPFEVSTGLRFFPDATDPTPIRDRAEYITSTFRLQLILQLFYELTNELSLTLSPAETFRRMFTLRMYDAQVSRKYRNADRQRFLNEKERERTAKPRAGIRKAWDEKNPKRAAKIFVEHWLLPIQKELQSGKMKPAEAALRMQRAAESLVRMGENYIDPTKTMRIPARLAYFAGFSTKDRELFTADQAVRDQQVRITQAGVLALIQSLIDRGK